MTKLYKCLLILLALSPQEISNELEVNLAPGGAVTQSSTYFEGDAEYAVDGNPDTTCMETVAGSNPWWRLDLRAAYRVNRVDITNRFVCCSDEINGVEIRIGNSVENDGNNNPLCAVVADIPAGQTYRYSCAGMEGRYVNLYLPGDKKILTVCEVEVYGEGLFVVKTRVKVQFSSSTDLTDSAMRKNLLQQLGTTLDNRGLKYVTVLWSQPPVKENQHDIFSKNVLFPDCSEGNKSFGNQDHFCSMPMLFK